MSSANFRVSVSCDSLQSRIDPGHLRKPNWKKRLCISSRIVIRCIKVSLESQITLYTVSLLYFIKGCWALSSNFVKTPSDSAKTSVGFDVSFVLRLGETPSLTEHYLSNEILHYLPYHQRVVTPTGKVYVAYGKRSAYVSNKEKYFTCTPWNSIVALTGCGFHPPELSFPVITPMIRSCRFDQINYSQLRTTTE